MPNRSNCGQASKRVLPAAFAWGLLLVATALFFAFPCTYLTKTYHYAITIVQGIITFFVLLNFTMATFMDPGIIPKALPDERNKTHELQPMFLDVEIRSITMNLKWCVTCQFYRPPRCTHCGICDSCIEKFDHHCPWINNCIGRRNYRYFFMFLIWLSIHMILIFSLCVLYLYHHLSNLREVTTVVTLVIMVVIIVLFIPVLGLTFYHVMLITRGRTTNEQVTGKFYDMANPYTRGCSQNIISALCSTPFPSFWKYFDLEDTFQYDDQHSNNRGSNSYATPSHLSNTFQTSEQRISLDTTGPQASHSRDCEPSPPPYKINRNNMFLNLSSSTQSSIQHLRNLRAITPPVMSEGRRRHFDNSRRSLPPQHRLHSASQPHVNDYTLSDPGNLKNIKFSGGNNFSQSNMCNITQPLFNSVAALRQRENDDLKYNIHSISNSVAEIPTFPSIRFNDMKNTGDRSETCCLGNQTMEKLQEIANKSAVTEAFNNSCGNFNGSYENTLHDHSHLPSVHLSPVTVIGNACVDCQRTSASPCSSLASMEQIMSNDMSRMPGRRPLSFVKAMEMSDTLEPMSTESSLSYFQSMTVAPFYQSRSITQEENDTNTNGQEVSYEIRV